MEPVAQPAVACDPTETLFRCQGLMGPPVPPLQRALAMIGVGAILGAVGWYAVDHTFSWQHISAWLLANIVAFSTLAMLLMRNPLLAIGIGERGLTLIRQRGTRAFAWNEIEAARLQVYPVINMHATVPCLLIRARGENFELTLEFDEPTQQEFAEAIQDELDSRDIPATSPALPSFERMLSLAGAWVFAFSIAGLLAAHAMGYRTLGTIFGLGFLFTGTVLAMMTSRQRLSKIVLAATVILILGTATILWACGVNVREVLQKWEQVEKQAHRPA